MPLLFLLPSRSVGTDDVLGRLLESLDWPGTLLCLRSIEQLDLRWLCLLWRLHLYLDYSLQAAASGKTRKEQRLEM